MQLKTPIALIIYDRADLTQHVFDEILKQRPETLLVIGDGPRKDDIESKDRVLQARQIIDQVNWNCDVQTCYAEENLGCKKRVSSGLDWVFNKFERAIVLEDDCVPDPTFFSYCETLLDRYADESRVSVISGDNFQLGKSRSEESYYFSRYPHCWGWASWRRAWDAMDLELTQWPSYRGSSRFKNWVDSEEELQHWTGIFDMQMAGEIDSWAYPWTFSCFVSETLTALPNKNLVSNIGFGNRATHTTAEDHPMSNLPTESLSNITHPPIIERNHTADQATFAALFRQPPPPLPMAQPGLFRRLFHLAVMLLKAKT